MKLTATPITASGLPIRLPLPVRINVREPDPGDAIPDVDMRIVDVKFTAEIGDFNRKIVWRELFEFLRKYAQAMHRQRRDAARFLTVHSLRVETQFDLGEPETAAVDFAVSDYMHVPHDVILDKMCHDLAHYLVAPR